MICPQILSDGVQHTLKLFELVHSSVCYEAFTIQCTVLSQEVRKNYARF